MDRHRMGMTFQGQMDMGHQDLMGMVYLMGMTFQGQMDMGHQDLMGMVYLMGMTFHPLMDIVRPRGPPVGWRWSRPLFPSNHIWR